MLRSLGVIASNHSQLTQETIKVPRNKCKNTLRLEAQCRKGMCALFVIFFYLRAGVARSLSHAFGLFGLGQNLPDGVALGRHSHFRNWLPKMKERRAGIQGTEPNLSQSCLQKTGVFSFPGLILFVASAEAATARPTPTC